MFMRRGGGDYDHLARVKEWSLTGGEAEDGGRRRMSDRDHSRRGARPAAPGVRSGGVGLGVGQCRLRQDLRAGAARDPPAARRHRSVEDPLPHLHQGGRRQHGEPRVRAARAAGPRSTTTRSTRKSAGPASSASTPSGCARARKLFAEALETPGGLKVQTIHAFCTRLLQQFPFEADVAARFQVLEETQQKQMLEEIRIDVLLAASAQARQRRAAARSRPSSRWRATSRSSSRSPKRSASASR